MKSRIDNNIRNLASYIIVFFITWSIYEIGVATYIQANYPEYVHTLSKAIIKVLVWILPVFLYLKLYDKVRPLSYLRLKENVKEGLMGAISLSLFFLFYTLLRINILGTLMVDFNLGIHGWLNVVLLAGFTEEIVFRGFLLRKLWEMISFKRAMIISSFLFLVIHFPIWYVRGMGGIADFLFASLYLFVIGLLQAYVYKKTDSLWACIISHSLHNFIVSILVLVQM
ncbi:CPBP family intramembrane glutamic endopeptidase [Halonatronum saccharophilum]|uniref:CPBP family intramembrane glutamic endopeptidase n=1 Tax=Halonatronum saccharophilum TaxID=150060 RepID=UPI000489D94A|nr:type II CAAX endopeptidase family protein [Halonatronum saccharophilum]